jgi:NDP-sugar pyrophosphorylase family protein
MGIYVLEPRVTGLITPGEPCDFPDLVGRLLARGEKVRAHVHDGYWLDIGRPEDYETANRYVEEHPELFPVGSGAAR